MRALSTLLAAMLILASAALAAERTVVLDAATAQPDGDKANLTFRLSGASPFRVQTLEKPDRLVIDLPPVDWVLPPARLSDVIGNIPGVKALRYGSFRPGTYRIVLDLDGPVIIAPPATQVRADAFWLTLAWQQAAQFRRQQFGTHSYVPVPKPRPTQARTRQKPLIVLDPGHGGIDPGATGALGTQEKAITLRAAEILAAQLLETGNFNVLLTRTSDRFLKLGERVEFARRAKADLFISLHADSAGSDSAQGLSVYTLSETASDESAALLASRENKADVIAGVDLTEESAGAVTILIDLAQRQTMNQSLRFANHLIQSSATRVPILSRAHRQAGFAVLKAPDIPAVLIELGFLSNPDEEQLLNSAIHLTQIAHAVSAAIDNYFADRVAERQ